MTAREIAIAKMSSRPETSLNSGYFFDFSLKRIDHWNGINLDEGQESQFSKAYHALLARSYRALIPEGASVLEIGCGDGRLLRAIEPVRGHGIDFASRMVERATSKSEGLNLAFTIEDGHFVRLDEPFDYIILSDLVDDVWDVQALFENLAEQITSDTRIVLNAYSKVWAPVLGLARKVGLATPVLRQNCLSPGDVRNIAEISGLELIRTFPDVLFPADLPFVAPLLNRGLVRIWPFRHLALSNFYVLRAAPRRPRQSTRVSVIVPARNESGNIPKIIDRIPKMGSHTEIVFVEGGSSDDTFAKIEEEIATRKDDAIKVFAQDGKGKKNAVERGFEKASGDLLMILDADMTVLPEDLPKFYQAWARGNGEFINGVRLSYPMEDEAMRPLNLIGNRLFGGLMSWILGQKVQDSLCGTKVLTRRHYEEIRRNNPRMSQIDPFGDFYLLFGAANLNLKIKDIPIRYQDRTYGQTNISRWRNGFQLLNMCFYAMRRFRFY